jgi:hypothetical protein
MSLDSKESHRDITRMASHVAARFNFGRSKFGHRGAFSVGTRVGAQQNVGGFRRIPNRGPNVSANDWDRDMLCGLLDLRNLTASDAMIHCEILTVCVELPNNKQYSKIDNILCCSLSRIDLML